MSNPTIPREKIAKMLLRLGSEFPGEIVATAAAIGRALQSVGADWNDFSADVARPALPVVYARTRRRPRTRRPASAPTWNTLTITQQVEWLNTISGANWLSAWEADFVSNIIARLRGEWRLNRPITQRQKEVLDRLLAKSWERRAGP